MVRSTMFQNKRNLKFTRTNKHMNMKYDMKNYSHVCVYTTDAPDSSFPNPARAEARLETVDCKCSVVA